LSENRQSPEFTNFLEKIKGQIDIAELYTDLTKEAFTNVDGRNRARIAWRNDNNPSLCLSSGKNLLTDFTDQDEKSEKVGKTYNVFDILIKCGGAINFWHAVQIASKKVELQTEFKSFLKLKKEESGYEGSPVLGEKIIEVWNLCKQNLLDKVRDAGKRTIDLKQFFEKRNIPWDEQFIDVVNIGFLPTYDEIFNILKDNDILPKGKGKELNIFKKEFGEKSIVFPLYNLNGALCGLRFRNIEHKSFLEWIPMDHSCFFNANRFQKFLKSKKRLLLVEGEMNVIAYAIAIYKEHSNAVAVDNYLAQIYSTGSKSNSALPFRNRIREVLYIQDNDIGDIDKYTFPKEHPILRTCLKIDKDIDADDVRMVNWDEGFPVKGDLEDFLKINNYDRHKIDDMNKVTVVDYALNYINYYCNTFDDIDIQNELRVKYIAEMTSLFSTYARREMFKKKAQERFNITNKQLEFVGSSIAKVGEYSTNDMGHIIKQCEDKNGEPFIKTCTNFYTRIRTSSTRYPLFSKPRKEFKIEVVIDGIVRGVFDISSDDSINPNQFKIGIRNAVTHTDLKYEDESLRDKKFQEVIMALNDSIPAKEERHIFMSLGRPEPDPEENICAAILRTEIYCVMPQYSVVNGSIEDNTETNIHFELPLAKDKMMFEFSKLNESEFKKAGDLFWNDLRHIHDQNVMDTLIGQVFDSCTRELQAYGLVQADHGFPIYLAGESGSYKTTAALGAMSLVGKFKTQNDVLNWHATGLAIENQLLPVGTLTHVIDDMKIEEIQSKDFISFFHSIYGGSTKSRMNSTGMEMKGGKQLRCSAIITAETGDVNIPESIAARMLMLRIKKCNPDIGLQRKEHLQKLYDEMHNDKTYNIELMCGFMPRIVEWAQRRGSGPYRECVVKWKRYFEKIVADRKNNIERPTDMATRVVAAFDTICEFMKANKLIESSIIDKRFQEFIDFWSHEINKQVNRIEGQSSVFKTIGLLWQALKSNELQVREFKNGRWAEQVSRYNQQHYLYDITYPNDKGRKILIVGSNGLIKVLNSLIAKNSPPLLLGKFIGDLKEHGVIEEELYPLPTSTGDIKWGEGTVGYQAIDYDKMIKLVERIHINDQNS
jgi:hypothetical protein